MDIKQLKARIEEGVTHGWMGGVAVVHDGTSFDAVPAAYLTDVSWSGRGKALHVVTYFVADCLELTDKEFAAELNESLQRAIQYNR